MASRGEAGPGRDDADSERGRERRAMVRQQLQARGIRDTAVLAAFAELPRHRFVPEAMQALAYADQALPIGGGQTISQPFVVAEMLELARVCPGARVLEVGTGSGYQAALLAEMGAQVHTIERLPALARRSRALLQALGYTEVALRLGDGSLGWPEAAPFDAILVAAGCPEPPPPPLLEQLAEGGRLVIPLEAGGYQELTVIIREGDAYRRERCEACAFVPLIGAHGWPESGA